jgi:hypothetical protein
MKFDNIYEEEKYFPYMDISLDEAREIRYLIKNTEALKNGKVVCMSLKKEPNYIYANGVFYGSDCNKLFESFIYKRAHGYKVYTIVTEILSHKDYYGIDEFIYQIKNIKVNSFVEKMDPVSKKISYPEEEFIRK